MEYVILTPQAPPELQDLGFGGGIERLVAFLARGLALSGDTVAVVRADLGGCSAAGSTVRPDVHVEEGGVRQAFVGPGVAFELALARVVRSENARLVVIFDNSGDFSRPGLDEIVGVVSKARQRGWSAGIVVPFPLAELTFYHGGRSAAGAMFDKIRTICEQGRAAFPSRACEQDYRESGVATGSVAPFGVPALASVPGGGDANGTVVVVGRFGQWAVHKNHVVILEALATLRAAGWRGTADFIGPGTEQLAIPVKALDLSACVRLRGRVSEDVRTRLLRGASVHVLPSAIESYGFASAEALAAGKPIVVVAGTAPAELGADGVCCVEAIRPCRFASAFGADPAMPIEPDPKDLATAIQAALEFAASGRPVSQPLSEKTAAAGIMRALFP